MPFPFRRVVRFKLTQATRKHWIEYSSNFEINFYKTAKIDLGFYFSWKNKMATNGETYITLKKSIDFHEMGLRQAWVRKIVFLEPVQRFIRSHRLTLEGIYKREKLLKRWMNRHYLYRDQLRSNVFKLYRIVPYILAMKAIDARKKLLKRWINRHYIYMERLNACD